jgi:hypothetical protein
VSVSFEDAGNQIAVFILISPTETLVPILTNFPLSMYLTLAMDLNFEVLEAFTCFSSCDDDWLELPVLL